VQAGPAFIWVGIVQNTSANFWVTCSGGNRAARFE
jgi:hypothetical protein